LEAVLFDTKRSPEKERRRENCNAPRLWDPRTEGEDWENIPLKNSSNANRRMGKVSLGWKGEKKQKGSTDHFRIGERMIASEKRLRGQFKKKSFGKPVSK